MKLDVSSFDASSLPDGLTDRLGDVLSVGEVVALEQRIAREGTPLAELMQRAGVGVFQAIGTFAALPASVCVLCGSGNNGGDGWVVARLLASTGCPVTLVAPRAADRISAEPAQGAALATPALATRTGNPTIVVAPEPEELEGILAESDVIVDAILGTGFSGASVKDPYAQWIALANEAAGEKLRVAVDCPSGMSAQDGTFAEPTFKADVTVTMLAVKTGLVADGAEEVTGKVLLAPLGDFR